MSDFMQIETFHGHCQRINNTSEGDIITPEQYAEYPSNEEAAAAYNVDPEDVKTVYGWFSRLSAPGYMDCTEWGGPYETEEEARQECQDLNEMDYSTTDSYATEQITDWSKGTEEYQQHENLDVYYEHGQHYATCNACGASWSIADSEPGPYSLEQLDEGDESCY